MSKDHEVSADAIDPHADVNPSSTTTLSELACARLTRRQVLGGGAASAATALFGSLGLSACGEDNPAMVMGLGFTAIPKGTEDLVRVPAGYTARVMYSWGDPLTARALPARISDLTVAEQETAAGDHHDGMYYFGLATASTTAPGTPDRFNSDRGILCINHEAITEDFAHPRGPSYNNLTVANLLQDSSARTDQNECLKEMALHGISVIEVKKDANGRFQFVQGSPLNRRLTVRTEMDITGPVAGSNLIVTKFSSQTGKTNKCRGTLNNCANGFTPWGTYLTCEENWAGYFGNSGTIPAEQARYGITLHGFQNLRWYTGPDNAAEELSRFQLNPTGADATLDYRNEANTFGFTVEIDPYDPTAVPKKRTAMGRMNKEGCWPRFKVGQKIAFYMGDDARNEYLYKFVTDAVFTGTEARNNNVLDSGTLYVAKFNADGSGTWLPLTVASLAAAGGAAAFPTQADICVKTRQAADLVGATRMDRPEWTAVSHDTGEIYLALTNSSQRRPSGAPTPVTRTSTINVDAANPRAYNDARAAVAPFISATANRGNANGHIIRLAETNDDGAATTFRWDNYLFGAQSDASPSTTNLSLLTSDQDFSSPDGLWFGREGNIGSRILWIQCDDGAYTDVTNNQMLAAIPGRVGDGTTITVASTVTESGGAVTSAMTATPIGALPTATTLKRFLVGPKGCEITGIDSTPDNKVLFVNIQHPGELGGFDHYNQTTNVFSQQSAFNTIPGDIRSRSATIVITKDDGGVIGF